LLGVFLNGLKDELKADVSIHKPRTVYNAMSLAFKYENKVKHTKTEKKTLWTASTQNSSTLRAGPEISDTEKQARYLRGECFRCGDKYGLGHRCITGTFKLLEGDEQEENPIPENNYTDKQQDDMAEISLHAILDKSHTSIMKVQGTLNSTKD
jgi:hypothetical protein